MSYEVKAAALTPPCSGKNVIVLDSTAASARLRFPKSWRHSIVTIQADGVDVYLNWGGTGASAVIAAVTTLSSEAPASHATGCSVKVPNGQERNYDLDLIEADFPGTADDPLANVRLAHIENATGGWIRITRTGLKVNLNETGIV